MSIPVVSVYPVVARTCFTSSLNRCAVGALKSSIKPYCCASFYNLIDNRAQSPCHWLCYYPITLVQRKCNVRIIGSSFTHAQLCDSYVRKKHSIVNNNTH